MTDGKKMIDDEIVKLNDYTHVRLRTEAYAGSRQPHTQAIMLYEDGVPIVKELTWVPAAFTLFREIVDNSLDEVSAKGFGDRIDITYDEATSEFSVKDNGRGIPIIKDVTHDQYKATMVLTEMKAGRNFGDRGNERGQNGFGASIVNYCSEYFTVEINRDRKNFVQNFREAADGKNSDLIIEEPMIFPVKKQTSTGTKVKFKLSRHVFHDLRLPDVLVRSRVYDVALCYPKVKFFYNGEQIKTKSVDQELFPNHKPIKLEVSNETCSSKFWLIPNFFTDISEYSHSMVNGIQVPDGGVHMDVFRKEFFKNLLATLEKESKRRKLNPNNSDIVDGLLIFNITEIKGPIFDSQSKTRLKNEDIGKLIRFSMDEPDFYKKVIRTYPDWIESIYERCRERTQKKDDADLKKIARQNKNVRVDNLVDACSKDRSKCILFLTEGDSSVSTLVEVRNPEYHGGLPLRGKVLNVNGKSLKAITEDETIMKIVNSVGLTIGQKANRATMRYKKIYITADADEDGKSITSQLINVFFTLWPELFDPWGEPFLYIFDTPLIIAEKGKQRKFWFADNAHEFDPEHHKGYTVTRCKGLGTLIKAWWEDILEKPKVTPIVDTDGNMKEVLDLLFNKKRADDRRDFIGIGI